MSQFGSMDEEKVIKKPLLPLSTMKKKKKLPSSWLSEAQVLSLKAALLFGCVYAGAAAYNLRDRQHGPPACPCPCQCQEPEPEPAWFVRRYVLTGADVVDAALALLRRLLMCSTAAATAAALALLAGGGRINRRYLDIRDAAFVALSATAASHWMYLRMIGLLRIDSPRDLYLAVETACVVAATALDVLGFMAFVLGVGGDGEQAAGRAPARAG